METNEILVFIATTDETDTSAYDIENWNHFEELPDDAVDFIQIARKQGGVFSLEEFQNAFNFELVNTTSWVFITNKY
jgi:hypothetical protein